MRRAGKAFFCGTALLLGIHLAPAANKPAPTSNEEGQKLAAELRLMRPTENFEVKGFLKIRDAAGKRTKVPFNYRFISGDQIWQSIYEIAAGGGVPAEKLQRIVHEAKIKMRKSRPCNVLESINPAPNAAGYARVRSWIDAESGGVILAEAYGPDNQLLKEFEVGGLTKVSGRWELKDMEMRTAKTDSKTVLEFKYEQKAE